MAHESRKEQKMKVFLKDILTGVLILGGHIGEFFDSILLLLKNVLTGVLIFGGLLVFI